jgi:essential nuclear protein 1
MALKKALFKPAAFFKGFLLPMAEHEPTSREAIIVGSILHKVSIPSFHSSAALIKLTEMDYNIATGYFIKVLIGKRYALPSVAIDMLLDFFTRFIEVDEETGKVPEMPVMWHQTLLTFVQTYRYNLTDEQRDRLKPLLKAQQHKTITPEIRRELFGMISTIEQQ